MKHFRPAVCLAAVFLLAAAVLCGLRLPVAAERGPYTEKTFYYDIVGESVTVNGYFGSETTVVIPERIADKPVTRIEGAIFVGATSVVRVDLPETLVYADPALFSDMPGLEEVILRSQNVAVTVPEGCTLTKRFPAYVDPNDQNKDNPGNNGGNAGTPTADKTAETRQKWRVLWIVTGTLGLAALALSVAAVIKALPVRRKKQ